MSNTIAPESAPEPSATEKAPLSPVVKPSSGQPNSAPSIDAAALRKEIAEQVREDLKREIREAQSTKDKRLDSWEKDKSKMDEIYAYVKRYPDNPEQALRELKVDKLLNSQPEPVSSPSDTGTVKKAGLEQRALDVLAKSKVLDPNEQLEIRQEWAKSAPPGGFDSDDDAVAAMGDFIAEFKIAKSKREAPASAAAAIAPRGGPAAVDLEKQYRAEIIAARGKGAMAGREIRNKYNELGLDTSKISF
jgi:hypothetical protein